jgi:hypothetical protein
VIDYRPNRLSLAFSDADDFMKLVRSLPKGAVIPGCSDDGLYASRQAKRPPSANARGPSHHNAVRPNRQTVKSIRQETESDGA